MKIFGYWKESLNNSEEYPIPIPNDESWDKKELFLKKLEFLESKASKNFYRGLLKCRICNKINGCSEFTYKKIKWPEGYRHYIEEHNVRPEEWVINFVMGVHIC